MSFKDDSGAEAEILMCAPSHAKVWGARIYHRAEMRANRAFSVCLSESKILVLTAPYTTIKQAVIGSIGARNLSVLDNIPRTVHFSVYLNGNNDRGDAHRLL